MAKDELDEVVELMSLVIEDTSVPKNIRGAVDEARSNVQDDEKKGVGVTTALYILEDISNDINMPAHTRTEIWKIISELEVVREKNKQGV